MQNLIYGEALDVRLTLARARDASPHHGGNRLLSP
jgi:hypothetical protein